MVIVIKKKCTHVIRGFMFRGSGDSKLLKKSVKREILQLRGSYFGGGGSLNNQEAFPNHCQNGTVQL